MLQELVNNCDRGERVPECTDELRDNSVCRDNPQSESLDLPVGPNIFIHNIDDNDTILDREG